MVFEKLNLTTQQERKGVRFVFELFPTLLCDGT
jgi:hypothetical protein